MRRPRKPGTSDPRGLHVVGPGFYLWDPDPREALRLAAELGRARASRPVAQLRRPPAPRTPFA